MLRKTQASFPGHCSAMSARPCVEPIILNFTLLEDFITLNVIIVAVFQYTKAVEDPHR